MEDIKSIFGIGYQFFALDYEGNLWSWGTNTNDLMCLGSTSDRLIPTKINGISGVETLTVGSHAIATLKDGSIWAWGRNDYGQLGDGTTIQKTVPTRITEFDTLSNIADIYVYGATSFIVKNENSIWGWGYNNYNIFGDVGTTVLNPIPITNN